MPRLRYKYGTSERMSKMISIFILTVFVLLNIGCPVCDNGSGNIVEHNEIIFTGFSQNSLVPGIHTVDRNGDYLQELVRNGVLYSPPSKGGSIVFKRQDTESGLNQIVMIGTDGEDETVILGENQIWSIAYPVLSPYGDLIAFDGGNNQLFIMDKFQNLTIRVSRDYARNTIPTFSPKGDKLAFFEGNRSTGPISVCIYDTLQQKTIKKIAYDFGMNYPIGEPSVKWIDNESFVYMISTDESDVIYIYSLSSDLINEIVFDRNVISFRGAYMPEVSPNGNWIAFTGRDGNVWTRELNNFDVEFKNHSKSGDGESNLFQAWSPDSRYILFAKYFQGESNAALYTVDIETGRINILSNSIERGYWKF